MKITQRMIDRANRVECFDFYLGITLICLSNINANVAWCCGAFAGCIHLFVMLTEREAKRMIEKQKEFENKENS